jgi:hypothetical protein
MVDITTQQNFEALIQRFQPALLEGDWQQCLDCVDKTLDNIKSLRTAELLLMKAFTYSRLNLPKLGGYTLEIIWRSEERNVFSIGLLDMLHKAGLLGMIVPFFLEESRKAIADRIELKTAVDGKTADLFSCLKILKIDEPLLIAQETRSNLKADINTMQKHKAKTI